MPLPFEGDPAHLGWLLVGASRRWTSSPVRACRLLRSCLRISSEQTEMPPPGPLMQSASVETSPRSSLDIAE